LVFSASTVLTSANETVCGVWKTVAGGNSTLATQGSGSTVGNYYTGEIPSNVFDQQNGTKHTLMGHA
jgi:hypothetical protein